MKRMNSAITYRLAGIKLWFWLPLLAVLLFAAGVRLYKLGEYPQRFNQDEMVMGYDAWSLWQTGRDHHGDLLPINFRAFNDFVPPVNTYITAPFVGIFGLDEATTRLPMALMGIGAVFLVALLGRRWFGATAGLLAALFLAIDPWQVNYSRIAFPTSSITFFIAAALYTFTRATSSLKLADEEGRPPGRVVIGWLMLSALCFALLTGTYAPMKLQGPLLLLTCLVAGSNLFWKHRRLVVGWLVVYAVCVSPLFITLLLQASGLQSRFNFVSAFNNTLWPIQAARLYTDHFDIGMLIFTGYGGGVGIHPPLIIGELFWLEAPLCVAAFIGLSRRRVSRRVAFNLTLLAVVWFLTYPIADSLTDGDATPGVIAGRPHEIRSYNFLPLPELLAGFGAVVIWQTLKRTRRGRLAALGLGLAGGVTFVVFAIIFLSYFFGPPLLETDTKPKDIPYNVGLRPVLDKVTSQLQPCDVIWLQQDNQAYMYYLFLTRYPPSRAHLFNLNVASPEGDLNISGFDQVRFGDPVADSKDSLSTPECEGQPHNIYYVTRKRLNWPGWQEIIVVNNRAGDLVWRAIEKAG